MKSGSDIRADFLQRKKSDTPLLCDGAMGTYLIQLGVPQQEHIWLTAALYTHYEAILQVHREYIEAGADCITTNTFRTNPIALEKVAADRYKNPVELAVKCAQDAAAGTSVLIAGSNPPAEDSYQVERTLYRQKLAYNHRKHIDQLMTAGVDFILLETFGHWDEADIASEWCEQGSIPYAISFYCTPDMRLLSGENLECVFNQYKSSNALSAGVNCVPPSLFRKLAAGTELPERFGCSCNCGVTSPDSGIIEASIPPSEFSEFMQSVDVHYTLLGACCGSTPNHISSLRKVFP